MELLRMFDPALPGDQLAGSLAHGDQWIIELCIVMALSHEVLLLDQGRIVFNGTPHELDVRADMKKEHMGV